MRKALALGAMISAGACSSAWAQSKVPTIESTQVRSLSASAVYTYDSNVSHTSQEVATQRGLTPADEIIAPRGNFELVQPIGSQAVFLEGYAGYDFHQRNKQLDRVNASITGGGVVAVARCKATIYGGYDARQSDPEDVPGKSVKNLMTTTSEAVSIGCGGGAGLNESLLYRHTSDDNSNPSRAVSNHSSDAVSGGLSYGNPTLGSIGIVASYARQEYPNRLTVAGVGDSFETESIGVTYSRLFGAKLKGSVAVSDALVKRQNVPVGRPATTSGLNYSVDGSYSVNSRLAIELAATRAFQPSNRPGKLYDLVTGAQLDAKYTLGTRIVLGVGGDLRDLRSNTDTAATSFVIPTRFHERAIFASASYRASRRASISLEVRQQDKTADIATFNYSDTRASITLDVSL